MNAKRLIINLIFILLLALFLSEPIGAEDSEVGRYQVVKIGNQASNWGQQALILDTKDGHLWILGRWSQSKPKPPYWAIVYEGKVIPKSKMGDMVSSDLSD